MTVRAGIFQQDYRPELFLCCFSAKKGKLTAAKKVRVVKPKAGVENQKTFKEMILMECYLVSIGKVKLTVGVHKSKHPVTHVLTI